MLYKLIFFFLFPIVLLAQNQSLDFEKLDSLSTVLSGIQYSANNYAYMENDKIFTISFPKDNFKVYSHDLLTSHAIYKMNNGKESMELTENIDFTKATHVEFGEKTPELQFTKIFFPKDYLRTKVFEDGEIMDILHPDYLEIFKAKGHHDGTINNIALLYMQLLRENELLNDEALVIERKDWHSLSIKDYERKYPKYLHYREEVKGPTKEELEQIAKEEKRKKEEQPKIDFAAEVIKTGNLLLEQLQWKPNITETEFLKSNMALKNYNLSRVNIAENTIVVQKDAANAKNWQEGPFKYVLDSHDVVLKYMVCVKNIKNDKNGEVRALFEKSRIKDSTSGEYFTSNENSYSIKIPKSPEQRDQFQYYITVDFVTIEKNSVLFLSIYTEKTAY